MSNTDYLVVEANTAAKLREAVKSHMIAGYVPIGGVAVYTEIYVEGIERERPVFVQAMAQ